MRPRRALLYMPGHDRHKIEKALTLGVDCICMDMEDGVALNRKAEARQGIAAALRELDFGRSEKLARINAVGSGLEEEDIQAVLPFRPDGVVLPKVETAGTNPVGQREDRSSGTGVWLAAAFDPVAGGGGDAQRHFESQGNRLPAAPGGAHLRGRRLRRQRGGHPHTRGGGTAVCPLGGGGGLRGVWIAGHRHGFG